MILAPREKLGMSASTVCRAPPSGDRRYRVRLWTLVELDRPSGSLSGRHPNGHGYHRHRVSLVNHLRIGVVLTAILQTKDSARQRRAAGSVDTNRERVKAITARWPAKRDVQVAEYSCRQGNAYKRSAIRDCHVRLKESGPIKTHEIPRRATCEGCRERI